MELFYINWISSFYLDVEGWKTWEGGHSSEVTYVKRWLVDIMQLLHSWDNRLSHASWLFSKLLSLLALYLHGNTLRVPCYILFAEGPTRPERALSCPPACPYCLTKVGRNERPLRVPPIYGRNERALSSQSAAMNLYFSLPLKVIRTSLPS